MKKLFSRTLLLLTLSVSLFGCSSDNPETDEIITNNEESTIIKDAKSTDGYLEKKDYKSIAYAYIYKIKEGAKTYKSHTTGSVKAKVLFFDYDISFNSLTYKNGSTFYSKDHSVSSLMTVEGEYYMVDREKLLVGSGSDKYDVYTTEEYHKISYTVDQYMVMGYVFTDKSITNSELLEDKGEVVKIKYTLDNELGTHLVKKDFKNSGGLSEYPTFKKVNITLAMKRDFTPISYSIDSVYTASKAFLGSTEATQTSECLFSEVGSEVVIPNESFLSEKLGAEPSKIDTNDEEKSIKTELIEAFEKLDYQKGVQVDGTLSLNLMEDLPIELAIEANAFFDLSKIGEENIYNIIGLHAMLEADENFGSLLSIVKMIAADKLGEYASLLDGFKKLEVVYDGEGELYLIPTNTEDATTIVGKIKLTDIINLVLKNVNLGSIVNEAQNDTFVYEKKAGEKEGDYVIEINLSEDAFKTVSEKVGSLLDNPDYSLIKTLLGYKAFDSIKINVSVVNGAVSSVDASLNYLKEGSSEEPDKVVSLITLHLDFSNVAYSFGDRLEYAGGLYESYTKILDLKNRLNALLDHVYVSNGYIADLDAAVAEYSGLTDTQKAFFGREVETEAERIKNDVQNVLAFLSVLRKYDLSHLNNEAILGLATAYYGASLNSSLLRAEISAEDYAIISDLESHVDYSTFDSALSKMVGDDETAWGLTAAEITDIKLLIDISKVVSSVNTNLLLKMMMAGIAMTVDQLETKINNLYANLE